VSASGEERTGGFSMPMSETSRYPAYVDEWNYSMNHKLERFSRA
jgi:hypothetical protein